MHDARECLGRRGEGFRGRATEGGWSLMGLVVELAFSASMTQASGPWILLVASVPDQFARTTTSFCNHLGAIVPSSWGHFEDAVTRECADSSKKSVMQASRVPRHRWGFLSRKAGREFRPSGHECHNSNTSAGDKGPLQKYYIVDSNPTRRELASYC